MTEHSCALAVGADGIVAARLIHTGESLLCRLDPAVTVRCGERVNLIHHHGAHVSEQLRMVDSARDEHDLQGFRSGQETIRPFDNVAPLLARTGVAVPHAYPEAHELVVPAQPVFLVVEERLDRAHVQDRDRCTLLGQGPRNEREESGLRLSPGRRGEDDAVCAVQRRLDGEFLDGPQASPAKGVDDMVLQSRV